MSFATSNKFNTILIYCPALVFICCCCCLFVHFFFFSLLDIDKPYHIAYRYMDPVQIITDNGSHWMASCFFFIFNNFEWMISILTFVSKEPWALYILKCNSNNISTDSFFFFRLLQFFTWFFVDNYKILIIYIIDFSLHFCLFSNIYTLHSPLSTIGVINHCFWMIHLIIINVNRNERAWQMFGGEKAGIIIE